MPEEGGNPECEIYRNEEQEACYSGRVSQVRHQGVQNREGLKQVLTIAIGFVKEAGDLMSVPSLSVRDVTKCTNVQEGNKSSNYVIGVKTFYSVLGRLVVESFADSIA